MTTFIYSSLLPDEYIRLNNINDPFILEMADSLMDCEETYKKVVKLAENISDSIPVKDVLEDAINLLDDFSRVGNEDYLVKLHKMLLDLNLELNSARKKALNAYDDLINLVE